MKSYLKFLSRNKLYTAIEAVGLAVSLAFVVLIGSYVVQQYHVVRSTPGWDRIYVPGTDEWASLGPWDKEDFEMNIPEVDVATRVSVLFNPEVLVDGVKYLGEGFTTDPDFFKIFKQFHFIEGSPEDFDRKDAVLVSESFARKISRDGEDVMGKAITVEGRDWTICGIIRDFEHEIFPSPQIITNVSRELEERGEREYGGIGGWMTFFTVHEGTSREALDLKVKDQIMKTYGRNWGERCEKWRTWRLDEIYFQSETTGIVKSGNLQMLRLLTAVVLLLLLSAIFNYVNLSFALTGKRAKEMATRRLLGADRRSILLKYIAESVLFTAVCFLFALVLAKAFLPFVDGLINAPDSRFEAPAEHIRLLLTPAYVAAYVALVLLLGVLCGIMPAWAASRFEPIDIIKGTLRRRSKMVFSKVFIIVQNTLAVILVSLALVMETQLSHMLHRPTHAQTENRYYLEYSASGYDQMKLLKDKIDRLPFVVNSGIGRGLPGHINMTLGIRKDDGTDFTLPVMLCDSTYFDLLGLRIIEDFGHPRPGSLWLGQSAWNAAEVSDSSASFAQQFAINSMRGEYLGGIFEDIPSKGITSSEVQDNIGVMIGRPEAFSYSHGLLIATVGEDKNYDKAIMEAYREYREEQYGFYEGPWTNGFLKKIYWNDLSPVRRTSRLVELFTVLSVLIALLGLLAMSTYFADENTKQVAIRKVFGGEIRGETLRQVRSYMLMVLVACLIGIPVSVWAAKIYLERYAYRIENYGWIFALAVLICLALALSSVLWQTLKAARTNPAVELKKE